MWRPSIRFWSGRSSLGLGCTLDCQPSPARCFPPAAKVAPIFGGAVVLNQHKFNGPACISPYPAPYFLVIQTSVQIQGDVPDQRSDLPKHVRSLVAFSHVCFERLPRGWNDHHPPFLALHTVPFTHLLAPL